LAGNILAKRHHAQEPDWSFDRYVHVSSPGSQIAKSRSAG